MKKPDYLTRPATVIDADTVRIGGSFFKRERTCKWEAITNPYGEIEEFMCECGRGMGEVPRFCPHCGARAERDS